MSVIHPDFNFAIEDLVPVGRQLRGSYVRDQPALAGFLPEDYNDAYLIDIFDPALALADGIVRSSVRIAERRLITQRIGAGMEALPTLLDHLSARIRKAAKVKPLTVPADGFGLQAARATCGHDDHAGLADALKIVLHNLAENQAALLAKGQSVAENAQIQKLYDDLIQDSAAQGTSLSDQRVFTTDNVKILNDFYAVITELLADGKDLFRTTDPTRLKDYTLAKILSKVRKARAAAEGGTPPTAPQ